jgi:hypothetical protein
LRSSPLRRAGFVLAFRSMSSVRIRYWNMLLKQAEKERKEMAKAGPS